MKSSFLELVCFNIHVRFLYKKNVSTEKSIESFVLSSVFSKQIEFQMDQLKAATYAPTVRNNRVTANLVTQSQTDKFKTNMLFNCAHC